ncbi:MCE family protein [Saccharomonospora azurea]|uniref:ABC-type transport system involved in resistance to organic solvents, periplasmic component n=1 Tax=Saccharomonospora azurea NA-128 TaxID=882081 RepID=H8GAH2_9PSEU|nr:MCE family protein [Saccharomonospora azurea]EHK87240.1 virulence factor Mce family protein [Saccharomonospora azurea SZMC 14600]EHY90637.1 ABC-type transport system involved in resistance to organic solvents, periplasmic component [Saccharomonospora azurea NA-128]
MRTTRLRKLGVRLTGVVFCLVLVLLVDLSVRIYDKEFTTSVSVTLQTDRVGNQLRQYSDVKARGVLVGEVRSITAVPDGAEIELALDPDTVSRLPKDVTALLVPKTLFGERYVQLSIPDDSTAAPLADGDVIDQDRSENAVELERAFDELLPVLQSVQPHKLSSTLSAVATALDGRGEQLGDTLVQAANYLEEFNPNLPALHENIRDLGEVAQLYGDISPDLLDALTDTAVTLGTVEEQGPELRGLYAQVTTTSGDVSAFLHANADNLIRLSAESRAPLEVAARYSPSFACTLRALDELTPAMDAVLGKGTDKPGLRMQGSLVTEPRGAYVPGADDPAYTADTGPRCYPSGVTPREGMAPSRPEQGAEALVPDRGGDDVDLGLPNSPQERQLLSTLLAGELGVGVDRVPEWSSVLVGPVYRGTEVTLK